MIHHDVSFYRKLILILNIWAYGVRWGLHSTTALSSLQMYYSHNKRILKSLSLNPYITYRKVRKWENIKIELIYQLGEQVSCINKTYLNR